MSLRHLARHALALPPHLALAKAAAWLRRQLVARLRDLSGRRRCSYPASPGPLGRRLTGPLAVLPPLPADAESWRHHVFDLLGSGPVRVAQDGDVAAQAWPGNHARARAILALIDDPAYEPIDWHRDFKSGYRWSPRRWGPSSPYGHLPGVDIKVPWELARLQHLPRLALAFAATGESCWAREARNQTLDFLAANPPGWGVNWACAMDVAIRAANLALTRELLLAHGWSEDTAFAAELSAGLLAHGRFIKARLEWSALHRANHYLADICGLAWIAATLPRTAETNSWLSFATTELVAEIPRQFLSDGANFEASTAYHRLSAEMATFTAALLVGLPAELPPLVFERLACAAHFAADVTKPSGEFVQIGDNDSGRFFILGAEAGPLDMSSLIAAINGLVETDLPGQGVESALVAALAGPAWQRPRPAATPAARLAGTAATPTTAPARLCIVPPDPAALDDLTTLAYPDFGLYLWKGKRAFISVRCGPIGQNGNGGHAHNDQLAVEIEIDGIAYARDPGTYLYTPDLAARNAYRSVAAHFAPRRGADEPARLLAPFRLEDRARAETLRFGPDFLGRHHGFGAAVTRRVAVEAGAVIIEDWPGEPGERVVRAPGELGPTLAFSPGYGLR